MILKGNVYAAQVVSRFYEEGKLGTQRQVEREIDGQSRPGAGKTFFDKDGHLIPYLKLSGFQQGWFTDWVFETGVNDVTQVREKIVAHDPQLRRECMSES